MEWLMQWHSLNKLSSVYRFSFPATHFHSTGVQLRLGFGSLYYAILLVNFTTSVLSLFLSERITRFSQPPRTSSHRINDIPIYVQLLHYAHHRPSHAQLQALSPLLACRVVNYWMGCEYMWLTSLCYTTYITASRLRLHSRSMEVGFAPCNVFFYTKPTPIQLQENRSHYVYIINIIIIALAIILFKYQHRHMCDAHWGSYIYAIRRWRQTKHQ